jgi:hypothetical protein
MVSVPQGLTEEQFAELSAKVRAATAHFSSDVRAHGSRVAGTARTDSDLDLAILVSDERFEQIVKERFKTPNPGSAKEGTLQWARENGIIQAGEAGLRSLRKTLERELGLAVDVSVIRLGGPFDRGPYLPLKKGTNDAGA